MAINYRDPKGNNPFGGYLDRTSQQAALREQTNPTPAPTRAFVPPSQVFMRRAPVTNNSRAAGAFGARPAPPSAAGFQRAFDDSGFEIPPDNPRHPDYAAAMARITPVPPPTPIQRRPPPPPQPGPTPPQTLPPRPVPTAPAAFKKGGAVKAAPVKKKAGGVIAKPKAGAAKAKPMPFKKGGPVKKGKK